MMNPYDISFQNNSQFQDQLAKMLLQGSTGNLVQNSQSEVHTPKVNGREGALNFSLPPNSDCIALDLTDKSIIWVIQTDAGGYRTVTPFDTNPHKEVKQEDVLKSLSNRVTKLEEAMNNGKYSGNNYSKSKSGDFHNDASDRSNAKG